MSLQSKQFHGDPACEAAAVSDPAHITFGARGPHVEKIQQALILLDDAIIFDQEIQGRFFGATTASAVLAYKQKRNIVNRSYQTEADNIVGKMTMASLDAGMLKRESAPTGPVQIKPMSNFAVRRPQPGEGSVQAFRASGGNTIRNDSNVVLRVPPFGIGSFEVLNAVGGQVMIDSPIATIRDADRQQAGPGEALEVRRSPHLFHLIGKVEAGSATIAAVASGGNLIGSIAGVGGHAFLQVKVGAIKPVATKEMNCVGQFEFDPALSDVELLQELQGGHWEPGTADFSAVPGGTVFVTPTFGNMLGAIFQQPVGSISRLNLFTHANKDLIGFSGRIEKRTVGHADVFINTNSTGDNLTAMDPTSMANLNQPGVFFEIGTGTSKKRVTVADIRTRFAENAMIVLYACHTGQLSTFVKSVAKFFNVKIVGFTVNIVYFPPSQTDPKKFIHTGMRIGLSGGSAVADFRTLINDGKATTQTP
jgi:peptidoglycan hydrolase-like protein with peptidoglycan-binding domain